MKKIIAIILMAVITVMAASAEWKTIRNSEDCGSFGTVQFAYGFDDDPDIKTFVLESPDDAIDITIKESRFKVVNITKDVFYTKGCEYAKVYGCCLFQNSIGVIDWVFLQPNGNYTVVTLKR